MSGLGVRWWIFSGDVLESLTVPSRRTRAVGLVGRGPSGQEVGGGFATLTTRSCAGLTGCRRLQNYAIPVAHASWPTGARRELVLLLPRRTTSPRDAVEAGEAADCPGSRMPAAHRRPCPDLPPSRSAPLIRAFPRRLVSLPPTHHSATHRSRSTHTNNRYVCQGSRRAKDLAGKEDGRVLQGASGHYLIIRWLHSQGG